jgi:hypothetical protein
MDLSKLQHLVAHALFDREADLTEASKNVLSQGQLNAEQRLGIYRNSTRAILKQHLAAIFSVSQQLIGQQRFAVLSNTFIDQNQPSTPYLADFGDCFNDFISQQEALKSHPYIADVASLEWMRHLAWHQPNQPIADFSQLSELNEQAQAELHFELPSSASMLHSAFAVDAIWLAHQAKNPLEVSEQLASLVLTSEVYVIIWRQGRHLKQSELSHAQWQFLQCVQQKYTLQALSDEFGSDITTLLATAVQQGWICNFN